MVEFRANDICVVGALAIALALGGCANVDLENKDAWFSKPFQFASSKGGFTFSELQESKVRTQPITIGSAMLQEVSYGWKDLDLIRF